MLPLLIGGAAVLLTGVGAAIYKYWSGDETNVVSLKRVAIWGRPNVGKTTFIARLRGRPIDALTKRASTSKRKYKEIPAISLDGKTYQIDEIIDMPGTKDRLSDWLELVRTYEQIFYLVNLARMGETAYQAAIRHDLMKTKEALCECSKADKSIHIIVSHIDESHLRDVNPAEVNNALHEDAIVREVLSKFQVLKAIFMLRTW